MAAKTCLVTPYLFSGLKVIDCASVIAAAAATMLADFGADVIKVEQPGSGDMLRLLSNIDTTPDADPDWFWELHGRNKRGLVLDLKSAQGQEVLHRLISDADVFITNYPYPVREALGLTYATLRELNPTLIYASLTAYGEEGPERDRKGFDQLAYWARSGLMDIMREPGTLPTQGLPGMGDHPTAVSLYAGIVTALLHRERSGEGAMVHTSLLANGLWSAAGIVQGAMAGGDMARYRERNRIYSPMLRPYETADGRWLQFNMIRDEEMLTRLLVALNAAELLADPRFSDLETMFGEAREPFGDEIQQIIRTKSATEWLSELDGHGLPVNMVATVEEAAVDEQARINAITVKPVSGELETPWIITHPVKVTSVAQVGPRRAPALGEHGREILAELGYSPDEIDALVSQGRFS
jgi:crotonobetainyl-CoA:carnitine CoA-transferase CaiB-like acyl-CoA transferase